MTEQTTEDQPVDTETETAATDVEETTDTTTEEPDMFPRSHVEDLRRENGKYRQRAQLADQYAQRLHTELVRATGRLADPSDLPYSEEHLDDPAALAAAVDELLARKPHLAARRPVGDIGQGASPSSSTVDLAALLRQRAR